MSNVINATRGPASGRPLEAIDVSAPRFWSKVAVGAVDDCWPWKGARLADRGYGAFTVKRGVLTVASRCAYALENGPIPPGKVVRHSCDSPGCNNPRHLLLGTQLDNGRDRIEHAITRTEARKLRTARRNGATKKSLAEDYGLSLQGVDRVLANEIHPVERAA